MDTNTAPTPANPEQTPLELMTDLVANLIDEGWVASDVLDLCHQAVVVVVEG